jgi:RsiW-degrading membrane proteinase PrsW (M82 family)
MTGGIPPALHLALALLPGLAWLFYFYRLDRFDREPAGLLLGTFAMGGLALLVAAPIECGLKARFFDGAPLDGLDARTKVAFLFGVVAPIEEALKILAAWAWVRRSPDFDEPMDGVLYAAAAALGFATAENLAFMASFGPQVVLGRGMLSCFLHASCSGVIGFAWSEVRFKGAPGFRFVFAFAVAVLLHGIFDLIALQDSTTAFAGLLAVLVIADVFLSRRIAHALMASPHRAPGVAG